MRCSAVLLSSLALLTPALAMPNRVQMAPRSFQSSNGMTCFYKCPATVPNNIAGGASDDTSPTPLGGQGATSDGKGYTCSYGQNGGNATCTYNVNDGTIDRNRSTPGCPAQAPKDGCSTDPTPGQGQFKRDKTKRTKTEAEQRIAERQYNPKAPKRAKGENLKHFARRTAKKAIVA